MDQIDWTLVRAFQATAAAGSLSAAARQLGLTQPTLSRQVAALETALGVTLFRRVGRKLVLTDTGAGLLEHATAMATAAEALALTAAGQALDVGGRVTISASDAVAAYLLPEIIARLRDKAPQIMVIVVASNAISDLRRGEADIAIRHLRPTEPELVGRLVGEATAHFYAADSWIARHGTPHTIADLVAAEFVGFEPVAQFCAHLAAAGIDVAPERFAVASENSVVVWEMVRQGLGVGMMLHEIAVRTPGVVRLLPDRPGTSVPLWLVTHRELYTSRRIRIVFDHLAAAFTGDRRPPATDGAPAVKAGG